MSGTYNEVVVKKLGQKKAKKAKAAALHLGSSTPSINPEIGSGSGHPHWPYEQEPPKIFNQQTAAWPASLQGFVTRVFEQSELLPAPKKAAFNEQIQTLIYTAARDKKIWTNDWTKQTLPVFDPVQRLCLYQDTKEAQKEVKIKPKMKNEPKTLDNKHKPGPLDSGERKRQRAARFQDTTAAPAPVVATPPSKSGSNNSHVVGTLMALEKRYLRLTSEPDPSLVRPLSILGSCLKHVVEKYRSTGGLYLYINDQLKAIRQDMTVQHIQTGLAIRVYETHGRIAIENDDLGEFNQCQAQLKHLYAQKDHPRYYKKTYEFACYRILYLLLTNNFADINLARLEHLDAESAVDLSEMTPEFDVRREGVYKALQLTDHVTLGNYSGFFRLYKWYKTADSMDRAFHLIDHSMANKQRLLALNIMCKAFKKIPLVLLQEQLVLDSAPVFLAEFALQPYISGADFDCAAARLGLQAIVDQGKFMKVDIKGQA